MANQQVSPAQTPGGNTATVAPNDGPISGGRDFTDVQPDDGADDGPISGERDFTDYGQDSVGDISGGGSATDHISRSYDVDSAADDTTESNDMPRNSNSDEAMPSGRSNGEYGTDTTMSGGAPASSGVDDVPLQNAPAVDQSPNDANI